MRASVNMTRCVDWWIDCWLQYNNFQNRNLTHIFFIPGRTEAGSHKWLSWKLFRCPDSSIFTICWQSLFRRTQKQEGLRRMTNTWLRVWFGNGEWYAMISIWVIETLQTQLNWVNFCNLCPTHQHYSFSLWMFLQEVQRNGKASIPAGRWPSLLSLTCPRSSGSGSGSELSLSSACSEYSSGSHTWAEGRGSSKQVCIIHPFSVVCAAETSHSITISLLVKNLSECHWPG